MAITGKGIIASDKSRTTVLLKLFEYLQTIEDKQLLTIIIGEDRDEDEIALLKKFISEHGDYEYEIYDGGQPVYSYLVGLE